MLDLPPITRKLMEHRPIMVKIPANNAGICNLVCNKPVTTPATIPAQKAPKTATHGLNPAAIIDIATAAPKGKLPSTVKSAISNTLANSITNLPLITLYKSMLFETSIFDKKV